jgi:hypothetical protein
VSETHRALSRARHWLLVTAVAAAGLRSAHVARAQSPDPWRLADGAERRILPGGRTTLAVPLVNAADTAASLRVLVRAPAGWHVSDLTPSDVVGPHGRALHFVSLSVGASVPVGRAVVGYSTLAGRRLLRVDSVRFVVAERRALSIAGEAPRYAAFGSAYTGRFIVRNAGNAARRFDVQLLSARSATLVGPVERTLASRGEDTILVRVQLDDGVVPQRSSITVRLRPAERDSAERLTAFTETAVFRAGGGEPWLLLPVTLTSRLGMQGSTLMAQGTGALAAPGSRVDFLVRGPRRTVSIDGSSDEYRFSLQMPRWGVQLGDQAVMLSPLTEQGRVATGMSVRLGDSSRSVVLGGVRTRQPGETTHLQELFGQIGATLPAALRVQASGLLRSGRAVDSGTVGTAQLSWSPQRSRRAEVEVARSANGGSAVRSMLAASAGRVALRAAATSADTAFPGYSRGSRIATGSFRWSLTRDLWLGGGGEDRRTTRGLLFDGGAQPDTLVANDPLREHRYQGGSVSIGVGHTLQLDAGRKRRDDPLGPQPWGVERVVGASLSLGGNAFRVMPRLELGESVNALRDRPASLRRASIDFRLGLGRRGAIYQTVGIDEGRSMYDSVDMRSWRSATTLDVQLARTRVNVGAQFGLLTIQNLWMGPMPTRRLDVSITQSLPSGQELLARVLWNPQTRNAVGGATRFELGIRMPLLVPVARPQTAGWIRGSIRDEESGTGADGVMIRLGDQLAMTDGKGEFQFARVAEGTHELDVDMNTVAPGRLLRDTAMGSVRAVRAVNGRRTDVRMTLVRGGRVAGRVLWYDQAPRTSFDSASLVKTPDVVLRGSASDVEIVLSHGARTVSVFTDASGEFDASGLEPGAWEVGVAPAQLPPTHAAGVAQSVVVRPGERSTVELRVAPRVRRMHIVTAQEAAAPPTTQPATAPATQPAADDLVVEHRKIVPAPRRLRRPAPRPVKPKVVPPRCPWPIVRPNGPICVEPAPADSVAAPVGRAPTP